MLYAYTKDHCAFCEDKILGIGYLLINKIDEPLLAICGNCYFDNDIKEFFETSLKKEINCE